VIIHHANCADGWVGAWVIQKALDNTSVPESEWVAANSGDPPPDVAGKNVWIVDFSYPKDVMIEIERTAKCLYVFDHHKTSVSAIEPLTCRWRHDIRRSAAHIAWEFFRVGPASPLVAYTEDRDLRLHNLPYTNEVNAAIRLEFPLTFEKCEELNATLSDPATLLPTIRRGEGALRQVESYIRSMVELAVIKTVAVGCERHVACIVNCPPINASELLGHLAETSAAAFALGYFCRANGVWQYSLRSRSKDAFDVSAVAKYFGGGGHHSDDVFESNLSPRDLLGVCY
jgi:uncharacterized protein